MRITQFFHRPYAWLRVLGQPAAYHTAAIREETARATQSLITSYLVVVCAFYIFNAAVYRIKGDVWMTVPMLSAFTAVAAAALLIYTRRRCSAKRQELAAHVINLLLYANSLQDILMQFTLPKLFYFALLLPVYAIIGARLRVIIPAIALSTITFCILAFRLETDVDGYMWLIGTALTAAFGLSASIRTALLKAVSARVQADELRQSAEILAQFDGLTGLPNRRNFIKALDEGLAAGGAFELALIDLNGFKPVNDIHGHAAGDAVLIAIGQRLITVAGADGKVARLGGDEFAVMVPAFETLQALTRFGETLCRTMADPIDVPGATVALSGAMGVFRVSADCGVSSSHILERADFALYQAKAQVGCAVVVFDAEHEGALQSLTRLDHTLKTCALEDELSLVFQPIYDTQLARTVAFEALARWHSPVLGTVPPDSFITAAERCGLVGEVTLCLFRKALAGAETWPDGVRLTFNVSALDIQAQDTVERLCAVIEATRFPAAQIEFEITETALLSDYDRATGGLKRLRALGCRIALDDFGAGYSSFNHIHRLPIDCLKIDRSFVDELLTNPRTVTVIKSLVDLCGNLGLMSIVEGVENAGQFRLLKHNGVRFMQGYMIARPMAGNAIPAFLEQEVPGAAHRLGFGR